MDVLVRFLGDPTRRAPTRLRVTAKSLMNEEMSCNQQANREARR